MNEQSAKEFLEEYVAITKENEALKQKAKILEHNIDMAKDNMMKQLERDIMEPIWKVFHHPLLTAEDAAKLVSIFNNTYHDVFDINLEDTYQHVARAKGVEDDGR